MRKYEAVYIFAPATEEEKRTQILDRFKGIIEENGSISNIDEWGNRKLAYLIDDIGERYYVLINFEAQPELIVELERNYRITDEVLKFIVVRVEE